MACVRNKNWLEDDDLKADLRKYVREGLSRSEILDFVRWYYSILKSLRREEQMTE